MAKNEFCKKKRYIFRLIWCNQTAFLSSTHAHKPKFIVIFRESILDLPLSLSFFPSLLVLCYRLCRRSFAWNCGWLTFQEGDKFNFQRVVCKQQNWQWISPQNVTFLWECNSVRFGQNIEYKVSLERSIFADVVAYQFINFNWNLSGGFRENCVHRSIWGRVRPYPSEKG